MIPVLDQLARRRSALVARSTAERAALAQALAPCARALAIADRVLNALRWALRGLSLVAVLRRLR